MKNALKGGRVERGTDLFGFSVNLLFLRFSLSFYSVTSLRNKAGKSKFYQQEKSKLRLAPLTLAVTSVLYIGGGKLMT